MKKKFTQKKLVVFTAVNITVSVTLLCLTIWVYIVEGENVPLSPIAIILYALLLVRIGMDYFHDRIKNKKSRLCLQSEVDRLTEKINDKNEHILQLCKIINKLEPGYDILSAVTIF